MYNKGIKILKEILDKERMFYQKSDFEIHIIYQMFSNTAGPYGGCGGSALTDFPIFILTYKGYIFSILMIDEDTYQIQKGKPPIWK